MPLLIDAHEDLANNILGMKRNYLIAAHEGRKLEEGSREVEAFGERLLGWPDYQRGRVALVFGTLFATPKEWQKYEWDTQTFESADKAYQLADDQLKIYHHLANENPTRFQLVASQVDLEGLMNGWMNGCAQYPDTTHPVGIVPLMEGADGIRTETDLEHFRQQGLHFIGPVWAGNRFCGGSRETGPLTAEGRQLLKNMAALDYCLDVSHMSNQSFLQSVDYYPGAIIASHANCRALLTGTKSERNLTDEAIRRLVERGAVIGVVPFNVFLDSTWVKNGPRRQVGLTRLVEHIDHICQIAGNASHIGIGSDFDGGFGRQDVPWEVESIADLQRLEKLLEEKEYNDSDIAAIFHGNWLRILGIVLPK